MIDSHLVCYDTEHDTDSVLCCQFCLRAPPQLASHSNSVLYDAEQESAKNQCKKKNVYLVAPIIIIFTRIVLSNFFGETE